MSTLSGITAFLEVLEVLETAQRLRPLPLTDDARRAWDDAYPSLLELYPQIVFEGREESLAIVKHYAKLVSAQFGASEINRDILFASLRLWLFASSHNKLSRSGIAFDDSALTVTWKGRQCRLIRAPGRFRLFKGLVMATPRPISPVAANDLLNPETIMSGDVIRMAVSRLRQSLRSADMHELAESIATDKFRPGYYQFLAK